MATKSFVPRGSNEGSIGTVAKPWLESRIRDAQAVRNMGRYTAGTTVSGQRVVVRGAAGVLYADSSNPAHAGAVLGVTNGAALAGTEVDVVERGAVDDAGWSWTPYQPLWLNGVGLISGTPPSSGFSCQIGFALTATRIYVAVQVPVVMI